MITKIILFITLLISTLFAQKPFIRFNYLNVEDGLSQSSVMCILQDRDGFMWFGTEDGLNRYDGYGFKVFKNDLADPATIGNNFIRSLYQDSTGQIWIGTARGLNSYNPKTGIFSRYNNIPELKGYYINTFYLDRQGELCITTRDNGFGFLDLKTKRYKAYNPAKYLDEPLTAGVRSVCQASTGEYFIATAGGLVKFNRQNEKFTLFQFSDVDNSVSGKQIVEDGVGNIWFGTFYKGLGRFNLKTQNITYYKHAPQNENSISDNHIISITKDKNRLWIGTEFGGLNIFDMKRKIFYRYPEEIEDKNAPFPLVMILIVAGTVIWAFFYILMHGVLEVQI